MLSTQLAKFARPLNNQFKSAVNFGVLIASRNISILSVPEIPFKKQVLKRRPELSLKFDPQSKKMSSQLGDEELRSNSSPKDSQFCSRCNAPRCKFLLDSSENGEVARSDTVTILIDRDAFCRAICGSSESRSPTVKTESSADGNDYCDQCKAPVCKLTPAKNQIKSDKDDVTSGKPIDLDKEPDYCDQCKAPKCKLNFDQKPNKSDVDVRSENPINLDKGPEYCRWCSAPKCKIQGNSENVGDGTAAKWSKGRNKVDATSSNTQRNKYTDGEAKPSGDITKSPQYCSDCKLPVCKYLPSNTTQAKNAWAVEKTTGTSTSSDKITITVNTADICGTICKDKGISRKPLTTGPSRRETAPQRKNFNSNYDKDNFKL